MLIINVTYKIQLNNATVGRKIEKNRYTGTSKVEKGKFLMLYMNMIEERINSNTDQPCARRIADVLDGAEVCERLKPQALSDPLLTSAGHMTSCSKQKGIRILHYLFYKLKMMFFPTKNN